MESKALYSLTAAAHIWIQISLYEPSVSPVFDIFLSGSESLLRVFKVRYLANCRLSIWF